MRTRKHLPELINEIDFLFETKDRFRSSVDSLYTIHTSRYLNFYSNLFGDDEFCSYIACLFLDMARNGVEWGNRNNPRKYLRVTNYVGQRAIIVSVEDQGDGFDYDAHFRLLRKGRNFTSRGRDGKKWRGGRGLRWLYEDKNILVNLEGQGNRIFALYEYPENLKVNPKARLVTEP